MWMVREVLRERLVRSDWSVEDLDAMVLKGLTPANPADPESDTEDAHAAAAAESTSGDG